jgi:hypothetical protein
MLSQKGKRCDLPVRISRSHCGFVPTLRSVTKKPITPGAQKRAQPEVEKRKAPHSGEVIERI